MNPPGTSRSRGGAACFAALPVWLFVALCLCVSLPLHAQVYEIQGGSSTLFGAHGATLQVYGENYIARASVGYFDHLRTGVSFLTKFHGYTLDAGDQSIPFSLPTDLFNRSYYFLGRGVSAERKFNKNHLFVYAGMTSTGFFAPYLNTASPQKPATLLFFDHEFSPTLHFYSYNILSNRQTSIQSLSWQPKKDLHLAVSAGVGSNQSYGAVSLEYDRSWMKILAGYVQAGRAFQRIRVDNPILSETDHENIRVELSPWSWLHMSFDRQNYVSPAEKGLFPRATVNGLGGSVNADGFVFHGELYDSHTADGNSRAIAAGVRRNFMNWLDISQDFFRSTQSHGAATQAFVTSFREKVTRRISLSQYVNTGNGQTSVSYGGTFYSNRFSFGVEYQTVYLPLLAGGQGHFKQVMVANVRLVLPHNVEVNGMTDVTPEGKLRYTGYFSAYAYRGLGAVAPGAPAIGPGMHAYVVRGRVVDETGEPVRGAAVRVQDEISYTNSEGEFEVRRKHGDESPFAVALEEFMVAGRYEVVKAPGKVKAAKDEMAVMQEVVVKRLPTLPGKTVGSSSAVATQVPATLPAALPVAEVASAIALQDLPLTPRALTLFKNSADVPLTGDLTYNRPGKGGNGSTPKTVVADADALPAGGLFAGNGAVAGASANATAANALGAVATPAIPSGADSVRPAPGDRSAARATPGDGWRILDSAGPPVAALGRPQHDRPCFGLAKQVGACSGPRGKVRVPARGKSRR